MIVDVVGGSVPRTTHDLTAQVRDALDRDELHLVYQPEYDVRNSTLVGVEALLRWTHPTLGLLGPDQFLQAVEHSELMGELGRWVITTAAAQYAGWHAPDVVLRVNVSSTQFTGDQLVETFAEVLTRFDLADAHLCAEITETARITDPLGVAFCVRRLQALGIQVALDDVGNGYSSLGSLRTLPVDVVKIDRTLVAGVDADERAKVILTALITMARDLGITVVAEGVQNDREVATLLALGCERAQGHHLGRPMSGSEMLSLLSAGHAPPPDALDRTGERVRPSPRPRPRPPR